jgi:molybdopterin synthase catalytic subunit
MEDFAFTFEKLRTETVIEQLADPGQGAVVLLVGTVRNQTGGRAVAYLAYEAYEEMALKVFAQIANKLRERWPSTRGIAIHHRLGQLGVGEISVIVAVGNPHRSEAFAACEYAIDTLKADAPIWKKEVWADGASDWVVPRA